MPDFKSYLAGSHLLSLQKCSTQMQCLIFFLPPKHSCVLKAHAIDSALRLLMNLHDAQEGLSSGRHPVKEQLQLVIAAVHPRHRIAGRSGAASRLWLQAQCASSHPAQRARHYPTPCLPGWPPGPPVARLRCLLNKKGGLRREFMSCIVSSQ